MNKKKLHDKLNHIISVTDDPYAFAVDDKHERKAVKAAVVSTLFASPTQIRTRLRLNARYGSDEVVKAAQNVMDFLEKNQYLSYVSVKVLNKVCEVLRNDTSVLTAMYPNMKLPKPKRPLFPLCLFLIGKDCRAKPIWFLTCVFYAIPIMIPICVR